MSLNNPNHNSISEVADNDEILKFCEFIDCSNIKIDFISTRENLFYFLLFSPIFFLIFAFTFSIDLAVFPSHFLILISSMGIFGYIGLHLVDDHYVIDRPQRFIYRHKKSNYSKNLSGKILLRFDEIRYVALTGRLKARHKQTDLHECKVSLISLNNKIFHITDWLETGTIYMDPFKVWKGECEIAGNELESVKKFANFLAQVMDTEYIEYPEFGGKLFISGVKPSYKMPYDIFDAIKYWSPLIIGFTILALIIFLQS